MFGSFVAVIRGVVIAENAIGIREYDRRLVAGHKTTRLRVRVFSNAETKIYV